jgi:hypothetical protein
MVTLSVQTPNPTVSLGIPIPTSDTSESLASPLQSVHAWRADKKAEQGAGFLEEQHIYASDLECACCEIHIGKDYYEQKLYLYPVYQEEVKLKGGYRSYELAVFQLCGDCAERKGLSDELLLFDHTIWQTTNYISTYQTRFAARQLEKQMRAIPASALSIVPLPRWQWFAVHLTFPTLPPAPERRTNDERKNRAPAEETEVLHQGINSLLESMGALAILKRCQVA